MLSHNIPLSARATLPSEYCLACGCYQSLWDLVSSLYPQLQKWISCTLAIAYHRNKACFPITQTYSVMDQSVQRSPEKYTNKTE